MRVRCSTTAERSSPATSREPRRRPEPLQRPGHADAGGRQRRDAPEARVPEDRQEADLRCGAGSPCLLLLRHDEENEERDSRRCRGENGEQAAPSDALDDHLGRAGRGQGAERAQHDVAAVGERDALGREPQDDGLEAGHQADGDAEADERAAEHEGPDAVGEREHERPGGGEEEQGAVDEPWSVAVEEHAAGEQHRGEHQEVRRREQRRGRRRSRPSSALEVSGDQRVDGAEQVGEVVAGREGQQHADDETGTGHGAWLRQQGSVAAARLALLPGFRIGCGLSYMRSTASRLQPSSLRSRRQTRRAGRSSVRLEQGAPDRLRQGGVVELDAEVGLLRSLAGPAPGGADLGGAGHDAEVGGAVGVLAVVGDEAHPDAHGERADGAGVAVLDGGERPDDRHWHSLLCRLLISRRFRGRPAARGPCGR